MAYKLFSRAFAGKTINLPHSEHVSADEPNVVRFDEDGNYILPVKTIRKLNKKGEVEETSKPVPVSKELAEAVAEFYPEVFITEA